jgi:PPIC-type PPIASE domain/SurA-like N-terminal domain
MNGWMFLNCGGIMRFLDLTVVLGTALSSVFALGQVASHAPTQMQASANVSSMPAAGALSTSSMQVTDKPVVRINGTELTDRDLLREMLAIFPYARQHNGFPKSDEAKIRTGALKMIEFEELAYQEAERRKMTVPPAKVQRAEREYRDQFPTQEEFDQYLKTEMKGSREALRRQIRRSLLVDAFLKAEVEDKSKVSLAEERAYYDKNPAAFRYKESFGLQTISIMPPDRASDEVRKEARRKAEDALRQAKATKTYEEFGLLAEKISQDDYHVNMGDHKLMESGKLPPEIVKAASGMQLGEVSNLLEFGSFYTFFRLYAHVPAGKVQFSDVKDKLRKDMEKDKYERLRAGLDQKLRQNAKVEEL